MPIAAPLDLRDPALARAVLDLQRRAYRIEADLIGFDRIPPLIERLEELMRSRERSLGVFLEGELAGLVSWTLEGDTIDLHRLAVDPSRTRRGIGALLVRAALAAELGARRAIVQTGAANDPARRLYLASGFTLRDEVAVVPGLRIARFERALR